jgi:hypothetical protein
MALSSAPTWTLNRSFLSAELAMLDDGQDTYMQEDEKSEYEWYVLLGQGGPGKADDPLKWWKVRCLLLLCFLYQPEPPPGSQAQNMVIWLRCHHGGLIFCHHSDIL